MADVKFTSVPSKRLSASITASDLTIQLNNIKGWDDVDLTASDFGTVMYAVLRNDANTLLELIELDPTTIASGSITVNKRGLKFTGDLTTEVAGNKLTWVKNETIVELGSNPPQLLNHIVRTIGAQTVAGKKTFSDLPATTAGNGIADNDLVRKAQLDAAALGQIGADKLIVTGIAGETVADGNLIYYDLTDNEWKLADADTAITVDNVLLGIAQGAGTDGNAITGGVLLMGVDDAQSGLVAGEIQYASDTAGGISNTPGTTEVTVGISISTTEFYFVPRVDQHITENIQDALAGNGGTPSASNLYGTQIGFQEGTETYGEDAGGDDTYVVALSPVVSAYTDGMRVFFQATTVNTGVATLDAGGGAKTIKKHGDAGVQDLDNGDIQAGQSVLLIFDSGNDYWELMGAPIVAKANAATLVSGGNADSLHVHSSVILVDVSNVSVNNSTTETNMFSQSIVGGTLGSSNGVKFWIKASAQMITGETLTFRLKYGTTTVATAILTNSIGGTFGTDPIIIEGYLVADGATNDQEGIIIVHTQDGTGAITTSRETGFTLITGTAAENSNGALNLVVSVEWGSANGANIFDSDTVIVNKI